MPIEKFQLQYPDQETPTLLLPADVSIITITNVIDWFTRLQIPIILGCLKKRNKFEKAFVANSVLRFPANHKHYPPTLGQRSLNAPYIIGKITRQSQ